MKTPETHTRIVIAGAGFAGVYAYLELSRKISRGKLPATVTLINASDRFLFLPLIHEVAGGNLFPANVITPLRSLPRRDFSSFVEGVITQIDLDRKKVRIRYGETLSGRRGQTDISYDYFISALGSETNFLGIPGAEKYSFPLKNLEDALTIKRRIIGLFDMAERAQTEEERRKFLSFAIVGGGPTGIELAAEISDLIKQCSLVFPWSANLVSINLVHAGPSLLPRTEPWFAARAFSILSQLRVRVLLNNAVTEVTADGLIFKNTELSAKTVIWAAGVAASEIPFKSQALIPHDALTRRVKVNSYLQLPTHPDFFVAGDQAFIANQDTGETYPMRAQFAVREGISAAKNIIRLIKQKPLVEFRSKDLGFIVSLGKGRALAKVLGAHWSGPVAWFMYRTAYFFKLLGWRLKIRTGLEWALNLFVKRDISKL